MANILYMAISRDGFIAGPDDETSWSDGSWEAFNAFVLSCHIVLLGRRTYEIMHDQDEFVDGPEYIVATSDKSFDAGDYEVRNIRTPADMPHAERVGIIGGGELNGRLAKMGVVDELILDIEPIDLHQGVRLFGRYDIPLKLEPLSTRELGNGTIQRHYKVHR